MTDATSTVRISDVLSLAFRVFLERASAFIPLTALLYLPIWAENYLATTQPGTKSMAVAIAILGLALLGLALLPLIQAILSHSTFELIVGRTTSFRESFGEGASRYLPVMGAVISVGLIVVLGLVMLVVPGLILLTATIVAAPACVVEQLGPFESIRRSMSLTRGHRWKILGLIILVGLAGAIPDVIIEQVAALLVGPAALVLDWLWNSTTTAFSVVLYATLYYQLRVAKEGMATHRLADVFE